MRRGLAIAAALALAGCAKPGTRVSSEVVWARVDASSFVVTPGDIVRIEAAGPVAVTSVMGAAEVTQTLVPKDGVAMFRPALGTTIVKVAGKGVVVHDGGPRDPEIAWFTLEHDAIAWSKTPLGTPFPALTPGPRLDPREASDLDAALTEAHVTSAQAIRALFALRAIRLLEGARIYPYSANGDERLPGTAREIKGRDFYAVAPGAPASVTLEGPTVLAVSSRVTRGAADVQAEVRVTEATRVRGSARSVVHHLRPDGETQKVADDEEKPDPTLSALRRILVHVPPGKHTYQVDVRGAPTWIAATNTKPYEQLLDWFGGSKNVRSLGEEARRECNSCAIALALTGGDVDPSFDAALAAAGPLAKRAALLLSAGAPFDRATTLESAASSRDKEAVAEAGRDAAATIDASFREAWARGTLRGTSWQTVDDSAPLSWFAASGGSKEISADLTELTPEPWRRAQAVRLLATGPCGQDPPVELEVNGQKLTAQPSGARATWHIVVPPGPAKVRRLDKGATKVYALEDGGGSLIGAALPLSAPRSLAYPANATAPGVELWLEPGASAESVTLTSGDGTEKLEVAVHAPAAGFGALSEDGTRWTRVATIPIPWSSAKASGSAKVAVRAVVRGVKGEVARPNVAPAERTPNADAVIAVSRKLLAAKTNPERAALALERGKLLASFGAERAALDDAELAQSYGSAAAVAEVQSAYQPTPQKAQDVSAPAYGIEPDFDPGARRCATGDGPRARISALDTQLRARRGAPYDRNLALAAANLKAASSDDPRGDMLVTLATNGSRWRLLRAADVEGGGGRVARPSDRERNPLVDADGRLRPHVLAGDPFGSRYISVAPERPARAAMSDLGGGGGGGKARLGVVCTPRKLPSANETCPLEVSIGDTKVPVTLSDDGHASVDLPRARGRGKSADLVVALAASHADYSALVRIVLDTAVAGTTKVDGVGFVLDTPRVQYRFLVAPNRPVRVKPAQIGLLRVDAEVEPGEKAEVFATIGGKEFPIPLNGEPKVLPISVANTPISIGSRGGSATVAIAERVETDSRTPEGSSPEAAALVATKTTESSSARMSLDDGAWRDIAEKSPKPYSWLPDHLGTFESFSGASLSTLRVGSVASTSLDAYGFEQISYRRRLENINLFTLVDGLVRIREGSPTYSASATAYEDWNAARLRITGTVDSFAQSIKDETQVTLRPRGFIEYSGRLTPSIYILPRAGYDGYLTSLKSGPRSLHEVDDDVFNAFRFARPHFAFLQALFWWVPFFDNIVYLRTRGTFDVGNGVFSHAGVRPGMFFMIGSLEVGGYADGQYFKATPGARTTSGIDITGGGTILYHLPITAGSFEARPSVEGIFRDDGGYQIIAGLTFLASAHRGVRDYSSLELSFPESTGGGVPWRTAGREGP